MKLNKAWLLSGGSFEDGFGGPPNDWQHAEISPDRTSGDSGVEYTGISFKNDAFEIWIYKKYEDDPRDKYKVFMSATTFRRMALWYLWRWAWGEWFGLRRRLFYWDLHRRVQRWKARP